MIGNLVFELTVENKDLKKYRMKSGHIIKGMLLNVIRKEKIDKNKTLVTFRPVTGGENG